MRVRCEKVESQIQEQVFSHKREYEAGQERYQDMVNNYDKQVRELRAQANLKVKDIQNQREDIQDLETRLQQKTNELKSLRSQHQILQNRYEETMAELDNQ